MSSRLGRWLRSLWRENAPAAPTPLQPAAAASRPPEAGPGPPPALALLETLLVEDASADEARRALTACHTAGLADEADRLLERVATETAPVWMRFLRAESLQTSDPNGARSLLLRLADDEATAAEAHLRLGDLEREAASLAEALAHYEQSLAFRFDSPRARAFADELRAQLLPKGGRDPHPTLTLPEDRLGPAAQRYRLLREVGRGGAGTVYLADDQRLGRRVALKILHPTRDKRADPGARIVAEARLAAGLSHPGIIRILDLDPEHRLIVMEYLAGGSLRDRMLPAEPLPSSTVSTLARRLADTLVAVHRRGIVHGDIKPANVLFRPGRIGLGEPVLADFGIARAPGVDAGARAAGTLAYMAPELRSGAGPSPSTDLYSLGVVLHECLAGAPPFRRASLLAGETPPPPPLPEETDPALARVVTELMSAAAADRPTSAADLLERLRTFDHLGAPGE